MELPEYGIDDYVHHLSQFCILKYQYMTLQTHSKQPRSMKSMQTITNPSYCATPEVR